jgi:protein TonB
MRKRARFRLSFGGVLAVSALMHGAVFAAAAVLASLEPRATLAVYTVRVVEAPAGVTGASTSRAPATRRASPAMQPVQAMAEPVTAPSPLAAAPPAPPTPMSPAPEELREDIAPPTTSGAAIPETATTASAPSGVTGQGPPAMDAETIDPGFTLVGAVTMPYPESARRARKAGRVRLEVEVGPDGRVMNVRVLEATPGWGFAEAARDAYEEARFSPPRWQGRPVRVLWRKTLVFQP